MRKVDSVLLVEDDPITVMVCDRIIKSTGFSDNVYSYRNGKTALEHLVKLGKDGKRFPEFIFLDLNMPVMNGWDLLSELEAMKNNFTQLPQVYILSSTIDPADYRRAKTFSLVKDFISKPLDKPSLESLG